MNRARRHLCGGCSAMDIPTATIGQILPLMAATQSSGKPPLTRWLAPGDPKPPPGTGANLAHPHDVVPVANCGRARAWTVRTQAWLHHAQEQAQGGALKLGITALLRYVIVMRVYQKKAQRKGLSLTLG